MLKTAIVLLNYNSADAIKHMVDVEIEKLNVCEKTEIIIIDNKSTDNSVEVLADWNKDCTILYSQENGGYAKGNNIGIKYAKEHGFKYVWILNSDIVFPDINIMKKLCHVIDTDDTVAVVSPVVFSGQGVEMNRNLYRPTFYDLTLGRIRYRRRGRDIDVELSGKDDTYCYNYKPQGCCMMLDIEKISNMGFLDESTFLYMEEPILAEMIINNGYRSTLCLCTKIIHNHSSKIKTIRHWVKMFGHQKRSELYYYNRYRHFNKAQSAICLSFTAIQYFIISRFKRFQ